MLSPDEQRDYERLFGEAGWFRLEKIWAERIAAIRANALETVKDEKSLWEHRGWIAVLEELVRLREDFLAAKEPAPETEPDYE